MDALADARVRLAGAVALQQFDLEQVQGLDIGQAQADRGVERRLPLEQARLAGDREQGIVRALPLVADAPEDRLAQTGVGDQLNYGVSLLND
jgi:hypothetical protein